MDPLKLELQAVESHLVWMNWEPNSGPLGKQEALLAAEPSTSPALSILLLLNKPVRRSVFINMHIHRIIETTTLYFS